MLEFITDILQILNNYITYIYPGLISIFVYKYFKTFFQIYSIKKVENFQLDFYNYSGLIQFFLSN